MRFGLRCAILIFGLIVHPWNGPLVAAQVMDGQVDCLELGAGIHESQSVLYTPTDRGVYCATMMPVASLIMQGDQDEEISFTLPSLEQGLVGPALPLGDSGIFGSIVSADRPPDQIWIVLHLAEDPSYEATPFLEVVCLGERILETDLDRSACGVSTRSQGLYELFDFTVPFASAVCGGGEPVDLILQLEVVWLPEQVPGPGEPFALERQWFQRHVSVC